MKCEQQSHRDFLAFLHERPSHLVKHRRMLMIVAEGWEGTFQLLQRMWCSGRSGRRRLVDHNSPHAEMIRSSIAWSLWQNGQPGHRLPNKR
ncbi:uncharacterized protein MYCFIDRAFT_169062 [Pseudocercospora fijiensis CIRAD86]|uniref:Uncharacterized protein n=1 Tax=Pseudocercospora fijiensis (strain CIRAD86) TaxID=383855 RepID=N1Q5K2_PSEFD|nr:uncharacterized protein MYCFIDRAFT_169062 [Pseudocercospora fijiensis CIRAD86]EME87200.1 hypothetical protein MYCFIDRAFT_169062 [Pseudocercospora fijiensis CIRAD86]